MGLSADMNVFGGFLPSRNKGLVGVLRPVIVVVIEGEEEGDYCKISLKKSLP